jgi:rod shape-determining protein MreB
LETVVAGRDTITGLPRRAIIRSEDIREALSEPVRQIIAAARRTLEATPPELAADLVQDGVILAGGGALLRGVDRALEDAIQLPVRVADDPLTCVARGTAEFLNQLHLYSRVLASGEDA